MKTLNEPPDGSARSWQAGVGGEDQSGVGLALHGPAPGDLNEVGNVVGQQRSLLGQAEREERFVILLVPAPLDRCNYIVSPGAKLFRDVA